MKKRKQPRKNNWCFICKEEGHFAKKCHNSSSNKLKACFETDEFIEDWSVVDSQDEVSDVYILTDASVSDNESVGNNTERGGESVLSSSFNKSSLFILWIIFACQYHKIMSMNKENR